MNGWRDCPICGEPEVPPWRATCGGCWYSMPPGLRQELLDAWRFRVIDQRHYQEVLAAALMWAIQGRQRRR